MKASERDGRWMRHALELAARGRFGASPNPMVGAVVLDRDGELVGEGYHAVCGGPHAEVVALEEAGERARGGTLYVTLEPCAHQGRTPPCVGAVIAAGLRRVVTAHRDPTTLAGGGLDRLSGAGLEVSVGTERAAAEMLNRRWLIAARKNRPSVTLKAATSLDGRIATTTGESQWITSAASRHRSLELREEHDAILVGVGTVLADDPRLTRRLGINPGDTWLRVVLDSKLRTPPAAHVVRDEPQQTLLIHTAAAPPERRSALTAAGVETLEVEAEPSGRVALWPVMEALRRRGVTSLLVEGGAAVHGAFVDRDLVDELVFFVAPILLGGNGPPAIGGTGVDVLADAPRFGFVSVDRRDDDLELHALREGAAGVHRPD